MNKVQRAVLIVLLLILLSLVCVFFFARPGDGKKTSGDGMNPVPYVEKGKEEETGVSVPDSQEQGLQDDSPAGSSGTEGQTGTSDPVISVEAEDGRSSQGNAYSPDEISGGQTGISRKELPEIEIPITGEPGDTEIPVETQESGGTVQENNESENQATGAEIQDNGDIQLPLAP